MRKPVLVFIGAIACCVSPALAADYGVVHVDTVVNAPIDKAWAAVGPFCAIAIWSPDHAPCKLEGSDAVGAQRHMPPGNLTELMVAKTKYSYTYIQPEKDLIYHGFLGAEPVDKSHTRLTFTALYNQQSFATADAKAAELKRREDRWNFQLSRMKTLAETIK